MTTLLETGIGGTERLLGSRFLVSVLVPVLLAAGASALVLTISTGHTPAEELRAWQHYSGSGQLLIAVWVALGLLGVSYVLGIFHLSLLRVLEGFWPSAPAMRRRRIRRHRAKAEAGWTRVRQLAAGDDQTGATALAAQLLASYPPPTRLANGCMPTALGNRLRAAEYYPLERYGIDAVIIWSRLRPLLPPEATDQATGARTTLDATVSLLVLATAFGTVWPVVALADGHAALAAFCLLAWPVALAAHQAALHAAAAYGQQVRIVFDLHRHVLLDHLGIAAPDDAVEERDLWDSLAQFYQRNMPLPSKSA